LLNPKCYEAIPPYLVGKKTKIYIDHLASRAAVKHALKKMGLPITEKKINEVLYSLKEKREKKWVMEIEM